MTDTLRETLKALVVKHRRHVELSPGVGEDAQRYGIAVCDDILSDLDALLVSDGPAEGGGEHVRHPDDTVCSCGDKTCTKGTWMGAI